MQLYVGERRLQSPRVVKDSDDLRSVVLDDGAHDLGLSRPSPENYIRRQLVNLRIHLGSLALGSITREQQVAGAPDAVLFRKITLIVFLLQSALVDQRVITGSQNLNDLIDVDEPVGNDSSRDVHLRRCISRDIARRKLA